MAVTSHVVDFTNVKDAAMFTKKRVPAGDYLAKVTKVVDAPTKTDQTPQYLFTIVLEKYKHESYPFYCKLVENQLWKLRNLMVAAGIAVPKKRFRVDPSKILNRLIAVSVENDEYEGKLQSKVSAAFPAAELTLESSAESEDEVTESDETEETEEEPEEEAEEESGDQFDSMDRAGLKVFIREHDANFRFLKTQSDDDLREAARGFITQNLEEEELDPTPPARGSKPKPAEEDELDIDDL